MDNNESIEKIVRLGLSENEARIYTALLERKELSAMEIHELTGVPRTKVYEITQRMILRGTCIKKQKGKKKMYEALEPRRAFNNLIREYENELDEKKKLAKDLHKMIYPIYSRRMANVDISEYVEIIDDLPSIHERYVSLVINTKQEYIGFVKPPYAHQHKNGKLSEQEHVGLEMLKRGVIARVLYEMPSEVDIERRISHIEKFSQMGEKARVIERVPIKMYIFDGRYVLMALDTARRATSTLTMLVIEHRGLAQAGRMLFDFLWKEAQNYIVLKDLVKKKEQGTVGSS